MTDFVLELGKKTRETGLINLQVCFIKTENYANFLKQPLELWMFVTCDESKNVIDETVHYETWLKLHKSEGSTIGFDEHLKYQKAKERCLFEGWNLIAKTDITICIENELKHRLFLPNCMTIENIVYTNSQLTKTAEKLIGL